MRTAFVVVCYPGFRKFSHIMQGAEDICIKHSPAVASVEAFDYAVLCRVARLDMGDVYIVPFAPFLERLGYELRSIVASYVLWLSVKLDNLFKQLDDSFCWHRHRDLLSHCNSVTVINDIQYTERSSALQPVTHKVN